MLCDYEYHQLYEPDLSGQLRCPACSGQKASKEIFLQQIALWTLLIGGVALIVSLLNK